MSALGDGGAQTLGHGWQVDQSARNALIDSYDLQSLRATEALNQITEFAAALCGTSIALVSLVDETRQRFLARAGTQLDGTPRAVSFCQHAMLGSDIMVVPDAREDPRFADNDLVTGEPRIRFYAGAPLRTEDGVPLGSLCVIDDKPRPEGLTALQRQGLTTLAASVMARLRDTRDAAASRHAESDARRQLDDSESRFHTLADTMPQMVWSTLPDGYHDYYNARWYEFTGTTPGTTDGEGWSNMFHPDDQERAWAVWRHSLTTGEQYQIEYRLRHFDGTYRWVLGRALPIRDDAGRITRWFGTCTDIHEQKLAAEERELVAQELAHRIKNIFAVISGLITFAARARPEIAEVAADLRDRITALGRAHDFVRPHSLASRPSLQQDSLHGLLTQLFAPYQQGGERIIITGDDVLVDDRSATPLALLFHELATNAVKYGALSTGSGSVALDVTVEGERTHMTWTETGGPAIRQSRSDSGFGSQLVELAAVRQLGGTITREWLERGLKLAMQVPVLSLRRA